MCGAHIQSTFSCSRHSHQNFTRFLAFYEQLLLTKIGTKLTNYHILQFWLLDEMFSFFQLGTMISSELTEHNRFSRDYGVSTYVVYIWITLLVWLLLFHPTYLQNSGKSICAQQESFYNTVPWSRHNGRPYWRIRQQHSPRLVAVAFVLQLSVMAFVMFVQRLV